MVQATDKYGSSRFSNESMQFCVAVVLVVWWLSGSGDSQSATSRLMIAVLC